MSRDTIIALALLGVAGLYWLGADVIRVSVLAGPVGAQAVPKGLAVALAVLSVFLLVQDQWRRRIAQVAGGGAQPDPDQRRKHLRALGMLLIGVGYVAVVDVIGYIPAVALLLLTAAWYVGRELSARLVLIAVVGSIVYYFLFVRLLGIPLPSGIWPELWRGVTG